MVDLEQQIKAWADAAAPPTGERIAAADLIAGGSSAPATALRGSGGTRWLAVAAAVLVVAAVGVGLAVQGDQPERIRAEQAAAPDATTTVPAVGFVGDLAFDELASVSNGSDAQTPGAAAAQTEAELDALWSAAGHPRTAPEVDFDRRVVLVVTVAGGTCPPELDAMRRSGTTEQVVIEPLFISLGTPCPESGGFTTFVVAMDWKVTGDEFLLVLDGLRPEDDEETLEVRRQRSGYTATPPTTAGEGAATTTTTAEDGAPVLGVRSSLALDARTVPVGGRLTGTVTVVNERGRPIEGTTCGDYFVASLRNDEFDQGVFREACLGPFTIPEGTSTYPVSVLIEVNGCTPIGITDPGLEPRCNPDGSMPAFPPGEYEFRIDDPQELVPAIDPVTITVTPA